MNLFLNSLCGLWNCCCGAGLAFGASLHNAVCIGWFFTSHGRARHASVVLSHWRSLRPWFGRWKMNSESIERMTRILGSNFSTFLGGRAVPSSGSIPERPLFQLRNSL